MKTRILIALIAVILAACAPAQTGTADIQNTAIAAAWTDAFLTQTAMPTATLPPPTVTPTATYVVFLATPPPTQAPISILTPNPIQVERWQEYQSELAKVLFSYSFPHILIYYDPEGALCEWDILGHSDREMYLWAHCKSADGLGGMSGPTLIYLKPDGSIREVKYSNPEEDPHNSELLVYDLHLFPIDIQEAFCLYYFFGFVPQCKPIIPDYQGNDGLPPRARLLFDHLKYRRTHPEEPPLVVLSAMPMATPTP